jgi:hypothetical protein
MVNGGAASIERQGAVRPGAMSIHRPIIQAEDLDETKKAFEVAAKEAKVWVQYRGP